VRLGISIGRPRLAESARVFAETLVSLANVVVAENRAYLREVGAPRLYESGVYYKNDNEGERGQYDSLDDIPTILDRGWGDCLHLTCWRVAELLEAGKAASVAVEFPSDDDETGLRIFHVVVRRGPKHIECPSTLLGMAPWQPPQSL
jgi:hypothetical protein